MPKQTKPCATCVLRLYGADAAAVQRAAQALPGVSAQCASRGAETLLALHAAHAAARQRAEKRLRAHFPCDVYGTGAQDLAAATVEALKRHDRLLACADEAAIALLAPRFERVEGAAHVFDFGAMSCANAEARAKIEQTAARRAPTRLVCARVRATVRVVGAELAAGCVPQPGGTLLLVGTQKGCYTRTVSEGENAALWLLDMVRRAACGLKQAPDTHWQRWRAALRAPAPKRHVAARVVRVCLLLLALAALAAGWYITGGNLAALPELLGLAHQPHSGAQLV